MSYTSTVYWVLYNLFWCWSLTCTLLTIDSTVTFLREVDIDLLPVNLVYCVVPLFKRKLFINGPCSISVLTAVLGGPYRTYAKNYVKTTRDNYFPKKYDSKIPNFSPICFVKFYCDYVINVCRYLNRGLLGRGFF